jgi:pyruvate carboxylase
MENNKNLEYYLKLHYKTEIQQDEDGSYFVEYPELKGCMSSGDTLEEAIKMAEDRQAFKDVMERIGEPCIASKVVTTVEDALSFAASIDYPVIVRPAYTLGGTGGGIAENEEILREIKMSKMIDSSDTEHNFDRYQETVLKEGPHESSHYGRRKRNETQTLNV